MSFNTNIEFLDKYKSTDNFITYLRSNLSESGTEIDLVSVDGLPTSGWVTLGGEEVIFYNNIITGDYPGLTGCERAPGSVSWPSGTAVEQRYNSEVINNLIRTLK